MEDNIFQPPPALDPSLVSVLHSLPRPVLAFDESGPVIFLNTKAQKLLGYQIAEVAGLPVESLLEPCTGSDFATALKAGIGGQRFSVRTKTGAVLQLKVTFGALRTPQSAIMLANLEDVTPAHERKLAAEGRPAERTPQPDAPHMKSLLTKSGDSHQPYDPEEMTLQRIKGPSNGDGAQVEVPPADNGVGESTILRLCNQCGTSLSLCGCGAPPKAKIDGTLQFEPGEMIAKRYQSVRILGYGGMATVYLVRDDSDQFFAMKILNWEHANDVEANERFEREAQAIRKLRHPNLISVFDFGKMPGGPLYFVMDFVQGESLLSVLKTEGRLNVTRTCKIFLQVCDAMAHAHQNGIIHRDLKPSNVVFLSQTGKTDQVIIVDFGIAKISQPWGARESRLTQDGQILGSPAYMSPEQCLGNEIDHRSDIYSVGCMMYRALSGAPPFSAEYPLALLFKHVNEDLPARIPASSEKIPERLEHIVLKALRKDPNERYQQMVDLETDLLEFVISDQESTRQ